jgi:hypothetical protein
MSAMSLTISSSAKRVGQNSVSLSSAGAINASLLSGFDKE